MLATEEECFTNVVQDFLICTTIHKAQQLGVFQSGIYVRITLDKMSRYTKSYENSENPFFNEYFVFEIKCTLGELLRLTILYETKKHTTCKKNPTIGELLIDLQSVWHQSNRCYFKKWGRLEAPIGQAPKTDGSDSKTEGHGFLQIDLAIVSQASSRTNLLKPNEEDLMAWNKWQIHQDYDDIEKFHPFKGKTNVAKNTQEPKWNQEVSFVWCYPSVAQTLGIQLLMHEHLQWKCVTDYELHFNEIAFKDKPALGPTFIHLYENKANESLYIGRLLLEIKSECLETESNHVMTLKKVPILDEKRYWEEQTFQVEFAAFQGDFIHSSSSNCKIAIKFEEHSSNFLECSLKNYPTTQKKGQQVIKNVKYFIPPSPFKSITLRAQMPDNRQKFQGDIFLQELLDYVKSELELFKLFQIQSSKHKHSQLKVLKVIFLQIIQKLQQIIEDKKLDYSSFKQATQWDLNRMVYLKDYLYKILEDLTSSRSKLKISEETYIDLVIENAGEELLQCCHDLQHLLTISLMQDSWPDLLLTLLVDGKDLGVCRLNAKSFIYSVKDREEGYNGQCWKLRNFIFKDIKCQHTCVNCGCIVGIIRGCLSIVAETESSDYLSQVVQNWKHPEPFYRTPHIPQTHFKCRLFIHQAKIRPGADRSGLCDPYIRVIISQNDAKTAVIFGSLSPIWNTVISFNNITLPGDFLFHLSNPPLVAVEVFDTDRKTSHDYLGCGTLLLSVIKGDWVDWYARENEGWGSEEVKRKHAIQKYELLKYLTPPPMKWIPIALNGVIRAEVLMSGELVEIGGNEEKSKVGEDDNTSSVTIGIPNAIRPNMKNFVLEVVFAGFRNYRKINFLHSKHQIKLMMADLTLTSGLSSTPIKNSMNFLIPYASGIVSLPEQLEYWPAIIATDMAVTSKGPESTLGATLISNSKKYVQPGLLIPCATDRDQGEMDSISTTIQLEEDEEETDNEHHPLVPTESHNSYWKSFVKKFSRKKSEPLEEELPEILDESEYNWWTKFYNSSLAEPCGALSSYKHKLCIYHNELEKQPEFSYLNDWAEPLNMIHGVRYKKNSLPKEEVYATLKLHLKITPCLCGRSKAGGEGAGDGEMLKPLATALNPRFQAQLQSLADLVKITVRVYIVQGLQLRPGEKNVQADSYVKVQLGIKQATNRANFVPNQSNPIFGKCFELEGLLPREHMLKVSVYNKGDIKDDTIGSTLIDLEDRWRSKHRATVGLAQEYNSFGYNRWHDHMMPSEILKELCRSNDLRPPKMMGNTIGVDGIRFEDETEIAKTEDIQERLSLTVLRNFEQLPSFGYKLVPQHVETRYLYRNDCPGIEQGKIQLWVELYDGNLNIPPPIDITPQPPQLYELRVIIYNLSDVVLDDRNIFGTAMSDIYVKGWCCIYDEAQNTDIHYRSLNGEGNFNWRMIFPLKYSIHEDMVVTKHRSGFMEQYELKQPPILSLQVMDNDLISADDFLGSLEINLSGFFEPYEDSKSCELSDVTQAIGSYGSTMNRVPKTRKRRKIINIFKKKNIRGWFPIRGNLRDSTKTGEIGLAGKIDLEIEVLTQQEAEMNPVGLGRNGPHALSEPNRPKTSFHPFKNPWKSFKNVMWPKLKGLIVVALIVVIGGFALIQLFTQLPSNIPGLGV